MRNIALTWLVAGAMLATLGTAKAADDVVIGVAGPFTGANAAQGAEMRRGVEQAASDVNAKGGILGRKVVLEFGDDAADPRQGVAVANRLVGRKAAAIIGHMNSGVTIPASAVYAEAGILMITPASTNPALTDQAAAKGWPAVFRTIGRDDAQGAFAGEFVAWQFPGKRIALIHDKTAFGKGLVDEMKKAINARGIQEAAFHAISVGERDFSALITKLKEARIEVIYYGGVHTEAALIVRQAADQGLKARLVAGDGALNPAFWEVAGPAGQGALMSFAADPQSAPAAAEVVARLKAAGTDPGGYTLYSYAAFQAIAAAAEKAKSFDGASLARALRSGTVATVAGTLAFDARGDVTDAKFTMFEWKDGRYHPFGQ